MFYRHEKEQYLETLEEIKVFLNLLRVTQVLKGSSLAACVQVTIKDFERAKWNLRRAMGMAKEAYVNPEFKGYINVNLTSTERELYGGWEIQDGELFDLVASRVQSGYKLSCSYNPQNDTFTASYNCNREKDPNKGFVLTAYAKDWYNAVRALVFKDDVLLENAWANATGRITDNIG